MPPTRSSAKTCLLIIDMINEFTFDGAPKLFPAIEETARTIAGLKRRMKGTRLPVVYVNDNFGKWQSDFRKLVARCLEEQEDSSGTSRVRISVWFAHTLKRKYTMSASWMTYSFPSRRNKPFSLTLASDPHASKSS